MNFHYLADLTFAGSVTWYRYGNLGVQLFFIISGFVIVQSLHGKTLREFATGRFIRLFPLFWLLCTITYLVTFIASPGSHLPFHDYLVNMTMLPDIYIGYYGHGGLIDASYWTLTVELLFYVGIGICCYLFSYKNIRYVLAGWLMLSMIAFAYNLDQDFYVKLLLVRHASYFIFGSALALIATKQARNVLEKYFDWLLLAASAICSIVIHKRALSEYLFPHPFDVSIITILLIIFFIGIPILVYMSRYVKNPRVIHGLAILGGLTYPIYLLHQRIGNVVIGYFTTRYYIPWDMFAIIFEIIIIAAAYVIYVQDKKIRTWLQKKLS